MDETRDGKKALSFFKNFAGKGFRYNVIFLDLIMPGINGCNATKLIRQIELSRRNFPTYICGVSSDNDPETQAMALEAGMD
jgi:CheY-like chemotaxis protein